MRNRQGIALVTVVLISALVLMTIVGVVSVVVNEKAMVTSDHGFKDALGTAEAGMAQTTVNLQNAYYDEKTKKWAELLSTEVFSTTEISAIASGSSVVPVTVNPFPAGSSSVLSLKVKKTAGALVDGGLQDGTVIHVMSMGEEYVPSMAHSEATLVGRRVLSATYRLVKHAVSVPDYAMYTEAGITFNGSNAYVKGGDIFANGVIELSNNENKPGGGPRLRPAGLYTVYSAGWINGNNTKNYPDLVADGGAGTMPMMLSTPTMAEMEQLAFEFRSGTGHYDGSAANVAAGYPCTTLLKSYLDDFLGVEPVDVGKMQPSSFSGIQSLCGDLMDPSGTWTLLSVTAVAQAGALRTSVADAYPELMKATYYVEVAKKNDSKLAGDGSLHAIGTIAVNPLEGELQLAAGAVIDSGQLLTFPSWSWWTDTTHTGIAMIVYGDFTATGTASDYRLNGQITVTGTFAGAGNFNIVGQLLVGRTIGIGGQFNITYVRSAEGSGTYYSLGFLLDGQSWKEESLGAFTSFQ